MKIRKNGVVAPAQLCSTVLGQRVIYHKKTLALVQESPLNEKSSVQSSSKVQSALHSAQEQLNETLFEAVSQKRIPLIARLLSQGAFINAVRGGLSPLHIAVANEDLETIACLLSHGADPNVAGPYGNTPLHEACLESSRKKVKIAEVLIIAGADVNAQNDLGQAPLHFHKNNSPTIYTQLAHLLLRAGAQMSVVDIKGNSPFDRLDEKQRNELIQFALLAQFDRR